MAIITPSAELALQIGSWQMGQQRYDLTEQSDGNGHTATRLGAPPRWRLRVGSVPALLAADSARWKATVLGLRGRINHLAMWDVTNPVPRGTARGTITLGASAAAGATSLQLAGSRGVNYVLGGSFETDANADGVADGWGRYSNGSTGALSAALSGTAVTHGSFSQQLVAAALGPLTTDRNGVLQTGAPVSRLAALPVTLQATIAATAGTTVMLYAAWRDGGGTPTGGDVFNSITANGGVQAITAAGTCPATAVTADIFVYQSAGAGVSAVLLVDSVVLVAGGAPGAYPAAPTWLAGDWLQIGTGVGSHYCMVSADATANDAGTAAVSIEPPLRQAISSGAAVTWDKPVAHYKLTADSQAWQGVPGSSDVGGFDLDLLEDWRP